MSTSFRWVFVLLGMSILSLSLQACGGGDETGEPECTSGADCDSGVCDQAAGICLPATCEDGLHNGSETDTDCGGACRACALGKLCGQDVDCAAGECLDADGALRCACPAGFEEREGACEDIDDCAGEPCQNGGSCVDGVDGYECICRDGFSGDDCETDIDDCAGEPCQNGGTCVDGVDEYSCSCQPGYSGQNCETDIDDCAGEPCQNGGACVDGVDSYQCTCPAGYSGHDCEVNVDDCADEPCAHGACTDLVDAYACQCDDGYYGPNCDTSCPSPAGVCLQVLACAQDTGLATSCLGCAPGHHGPVCTELCGPQANCAGMVSCAQDTGEALSCASCDDGYFGVLCQEACSPADTHCVEVTSCGQADGLPILCEGCEAGFTGADCQATCPDQPACVVLVCDQDTGEALSCDSCQAGSWGDTCEEECVGGAACLGEVSCEQETGAVLQCESCEAGFYGETCELACASISACVGTTSCDQETGAATSCSQCDVGLTGALCDEYYASCKAILDGAGQSLMDAIYVIDPDGTAGALEPFSVWCDMTTDGGGWTVILFSADLPFENHFTGGDLRRWLPEDFSTVLTTEQILAVQAVSTEGRQDYWGQCESVIHYSYSGDNYAMSFGFRFINGDETLFGVEDYSPVDITVIQDGCSANGGEGGLLENATIFEIRDVRVPVVNVSSMDAGDVSERFGSPLTFHPALLR